MTRSARAPIILGLLLGLLPLVAAGCGSDPTPAPRRLPEPKAAEVVALPTPTESPTAVAEPAVDEDQAAELDTVVTTTLEVGLPSDGDAPIVQFARIEPSPWEPEILADMHPNFSLQANGRIFYEFDGGSSREGWYQTALTPTLALDFVKLLWDEVGIAELAEALEAPDPAFETELNGQPIGSGPIGVIYVASTAGEVRLVVSQSDLENPSGPYADRLKRLDDIIRALQLWRNYTESEASDLVKTGVAGTLGWWLDRRVPYTPEAALAFATLARGYLPANANVASWPLQGADDLALAEQVDAGFGADPVEIALSRDDYVLVRAEERRRGESFWGPLWQVADGSRYLIGVRPAVPGANHSVIDYRYGVPKRGMQPAGGD
ncbi:MAG: hypothetical protein H6648_00600 [Caldilineae bacterium]|nr:hypothetical protein [Caldilineae bacterium]